MSNLLDILLCGVVGIMEFIVIIAGALLIQLICYQVFGFNLFKTLLKWIENITSEY